MPTSLIEGNSLIAVDVGSVTTRAIYFDIVEERYRFIGLGQAPTTLGAPFNDIGVGVRQAILQLQEVIDRPLLDSDQQLVIPALPEGAGVDVFVATLSAGPAVKVAVAGLLNDVSVASAQRLVQSTYGQVVDVLSLNDKRKPEVQMDNLVRLSPDVILVTGGTEGGASRSIHKMMETIGLACYLITQDKRPAVLYAGNQQAAAEVRKSLNGIASAVHVSPNLRPSLELEDIDPAQREMAGLLTTLRRRQIAGVEELNTWSTGALLPSAYTRGRMIRFIGELFKESGKGVLGVDVGASSTSVAMSFEGGLDLNVFPQFGLGEPLSNLLKYTSLESITQWLPIEVPAEVVRDYLYQKGLYPGTVPATAEDLAIEQALTRQVLNLSLRAVMKNLPRARFARPNLLPLFEPILAGGAALTNAPTTGQSLLMLLDALQPTGITSLALDPNNLLTAMGAASERISLLPVHVLESWAFISLATVISPISNANYGAPILRGRATYKDGSDTRIEVKQGSLEVIPLANGQTASLELQPLQRTDIGFGPGRGVKQIDVTGGVHGIVIDARGRPLVLPSDPVRRRELIKNWLFKVGG